MNRQPSPELECVDTVHVEFTLQALPPDPSWERHGRPARSFSLPPEEPEPNEQTPPTR